ncbi:MAG: hypothetical protein HYV59_08990 [Planctomycetes bacterium]|nr:hypothetical protein [Planctomycetota bacterium]
MSIEEARGKYEVTKRAVSACQTAIQQLQGKADALSESLPELGRAVEQAEKTKTAALDAFALKSDKMSEAELKRARAGYESAVRQQSETVELSEATERALKRQQAEISRLQASCDLARRQMLEAIATEIQTNIPPDTFVTVEKFLIARLQNGGIYDFHLKQLFPQPDTTRTREIAKELSTKYGISE